jgi:hypothetical protein
MSFRRRIFPEILESLLTSLTGGVAAESQPFPPPGATTPPYVNELLQPPVADIVSVWGNRDGDAHVFRKNVDYALSPDTAAVFHGNSVTRGFRSIPVVFTPSQVTTDTP